MPGPAFDITAVPDDLRDRALKRARETLSKLDEMRRSLELPPEQLPIVIDAYGNAVASLVAEAQRAEIAKHVSREPLTMRSTNRDYEPMKIPPGRITEVTARPQWIAFRPEDFAIHGDRSRWMVHDIKVGNRTQFSQKQGPAMGTEFGPGGICEHLQLETCQMAMDFAIVVEYVGPEPEGEVFEATIVGSAQAS